MSPESSSNITDVNNNNEQKNISTRGHVQHLIENLFKKLSLILIEFT